MTASRSKLYLDTSVPSALLDARSPDRQRLTAEFWVGRLSEFEPVISSLVAQEIEGVEDEAKRQQLQALVQPFRVLQVTEASTALAQEYLRYGIFKQRHFADALHAAVASTHGVQFVASWNFKHLVRVQTRRQVSLVNSLLGWGSLEIVAPPEV